MTSTPQLKDRSMQTMYLPMSSKIVPNPHIYLICLYPTPTMCSKLYKTLEGMYLYKRQNTTVERDLGTRITNNNSHL